MKKLSNLVYLLGIGSLCFTVSCGSKKDHKDIDAKSNEVIQNITAEEKAPVDLEKEVVTPAAEATQAETTSSDEDLAEVVPSQESLDSFSNQLANAGAVVGSTLDQGVEAFSGVLETTGDLTIRQIMEQNGQNFNDYIKTPAGWVYNGAKDAVSDYFSRWLTFYGLDQ